MQVDLRKITTPLGLLDDETRQRLEAIGGPYECFLDGQWRVEARLLYGDHAYRAALRKPSIDWGHVASRFNWLAADANGRAYLYEENPDIDGNMWRGGVKFTDAIGFASFSPGDCDWKDSLVRRPE